MSRLAVFRKLSAASVDRIHSQFFLIFQHLPSQGIRNQTRWSWRSHWGAVVDVIAGFLPLFILRCNRGNQKYKYKHRPQDCTLPVPSDYSRSLSILLSPLSDYYSSLMRILVFTSLFPSSTQPDFGIFIFQRISHLAQQPGNFVQVVAPVPYFPSWITSSRWGKYGLIPRQERVGDLDVYHPRYPLVPGFLMPLHGFLMFLGCFFLVRRLHRQFRFECIDAHYVYPDGFAAALLGRMLGLPVVVSARGTDINVFPLFPSIRPLIVWSLHTAAGIIAVSSALKNTMIALGLPPEKICVIPNGVDTKRFYPIPQEEARRTLGLPLDGRIAVSVASLTEAKNHPLLISAFAMIVGRSEGAKLFLIGEGPLRPAVEELIRKLRLQESVVLVGAKPNPELAVWYSAATVSCLVSSREGWPNVLMESIACGTPIVATRVGGVPEIISSSKLGLLAEQDIESIAAALESALAKSWDRNALVLHAQSREWNNVASEVDQYLATRVSPRATV
jgi:teichuronic acid biosynthesis glycosyltransferase TuaC